MGRMQGGGVRYVFQTRPTIHCKVLKHFFCFFVNAYVYISLSTYLYT